MAGLYLHIPFREAPCAYDDSPVVLARPPHTAYVEAVTAELRHYADRYDGPIRTVYIGGGRPSLLGLDALRRLLASVRNHFEASTLDEVTFELHPADANAAYLDGLRALGVDRLSVETMSFYPDDLDVLRASHSADRAQAALDLVHQSGFDRFSIDLGFGWADRDPLHWKANLQQAVRLEVPHITLIECVDEGVPAASEDARAAHYRFAMEYLPERGYEHYEISHFARPGRRGVHNQRHWDHTNYLGVGPSAHSFWWDELPAHRWSNVQNLARYEALLRQRHLPIARRTPLDLHALAEEYVLLRLRTRDGLDLDTLQARYEVDLPTQKADTLAQLVDEGYIEQRRDRRIRLTNRGMLVCDAVTQKLLPNECVC